ncbi:MAG: aldo/keto reductase [Polyangiaceae bacterium]
MPLRPLGATGLSVAPLVISGAGLLPPRAYEDARAAGCTHFFWEPRYATLERALRRERSAGVVAGTYEASERAIVADVERALRRLRRDAIDVFLLFWVRSPARIDADAFDVLDRLARAGKIRAFGFSTHDRDLACDALRRGDARPWDVVMIRHSAAHPGAEERLLPLARERGVGVLGFSALSYGRVLGAAVSAADAYGYALAQAGISACLSAPRTRAELEENLRVLSAPPLSLARQAELRAHGAIVREESRDFGRSIRRHPVGVLGEDAPEAGVAALGEWLDGEDALDPRFG